MEFAASKSTWIKVITAVFAAGFVALAVGTFLTEDNVGALLTPLFILILVFGLSYYFSVRHYEILGDSIIIHRPFDKVAIAKPESRMPYASKQKTCACRSGHSASAAYFHIPEHFGTANSAR